MKHTLTLTRWHKVAERINAALKERDARAVAAFTAATISPWNKEGVEQKAAAIGARAKADLAIVEAERRALRQGELEDRRVVAAMLPDYLDRLRLVQCFRCDGEADLLA